ncbi:MAG: transglutaminase-like domain-containing protein [Patescibacteria group bacterium]
MRFLIKFFAASFLFIISHLLFASPVSALATFATDYTVTYGIGEQGSTHVTFDIAQKNNLSTVYATSFSLSLSQTNIKNIRVSDASGELTPTVDRTDNLTNISFDFLAKIVGRDKVNRFTIQYDSADIAGKQGSIWEINIPRLETNENTNSQQIVLKVPGSFGQPAYIDPKPGRIEGNNYYFPSAVLANKSISAVFGTTQYFKLQLIYNLTNPLAKDLSTQIALPPDTAYQTVYLKKINPPPTDIATDPDGNWLASYTLNPNTDLQITTDIIIKLDFNPKKTPLSDFNLYTRATKLWDYTDPDIAAAATNLTTPKAIYDYVVNYLQYSYARINNGNDSGVNRPGAVWALANPSQAICTEFTDLFIALARKNGIPARENQGYAMSTNDKLKPLSLAKDVLHAWPEYYDKVKQTWIQIDPTWANTTGGIDYFNKLDLNHLVFAIHGLDATQPLPAGAYKTLGGGSKDVFVSIAPPEAFPKAQFRVKYADQNRERLFLTLENLSGVSGDATVSTSGKNSVESSTSANRLPPFGNTTVEVRLKPMFLVYPKTEQLIIDINGETINLTITRQPNLPAAVLWAAALSLALGLALLARGLYLRRRRRLPPVHW